MEVYGIVKHVELAKKENWKRSLLLVTLDVNGIEFVFPVEKAVIKDLSIDSTIGLNIEVYPLNWTRSKTKFLDDEPEETQNKVETKEDVPAPSQFTVPVETTPIMKLTDEELKDLYGVNDNAIPISKDVRVDSNLEDVSESEFTRQKVEISEKTEKSKKQGLDLSAKDTKNKDMRSKTTIKLPELSKKNKPTMNPKDKAMLGNLAGSLGNGVEESPED